MGRCRTCGKVWPLTPFDPETCPGCSTVMVMPKNVALRGIVEAAKRDREVVDLCVRNGLSLPMIRTLWSLSLEGLDMRGIAQRLGVHVATVERYDAALRALSSDDINKIQDYFGRRDA